MTVDRFCAGPSPSSLSRIWSRFVQANIHAPIINALNAVSQLAARHPAHCTSLLSCLSLVLLLSGFLTNLKLELDQSELWTPSNSLSHEHSTWIDDESNFPDRTRWVSIVFHQDGTNVIGQDQVARVFELLDQVTSLPGYSETCSQSDFVDPYGDPGSSGAEQYNELNVGGGAPPVHTCEIQGITRFWNNSRAMFLDSGVAQNESSPLWRLQETMSARVFPDGFPVAEDRVFGFAERRDNDDLISHALAFLVSIEIPNLAGALDLEKAILDVILEMREQWERPNEDGLRFRAEVSTSTTMSDEVERSIKADIPLTPFVFVIMSLFTCTFFARPFDKTKKSRSFLGMLALISVLLAISSGYGLMFICGVPFTSISTLIPFILFGIGLDDTFILVLAFERTEKQTTDHERDEELVLDRIRATVDEVGIPITLTSLTSAVAFALGGMLSSVPIVNYVCFYASVCVVFVYIYQLTFFIACIVFDEARIAQNRYDCLVCFVQKEEGTDGQLAEQEEDVHSITSEDGPPTTRCSGANCSSVLEDEDDASPCQHERNPSTSGCGDGDCGSLWDVVLSEDEPREGSCGIAGGPEQSRQHTAKTGRFRKWIQRLFSQTKQGSSLDKDGHGDVNTIEDGKTEADDQSLPQSHKPSFMRLYAEWLLTPVVKAVVAIVFIALTVACGYSASKLRQEFTMADVVPKDSYLVDFIRAQEDYGGRTAVEPFVYFRNVNQSDSNIHIQMESYVAELVATMDVISNPPASFWLPDFQQFVNGTSGLLQQPSAVQLDAFLADPVRFQLYRKMIVRDKETGDVTASRVLLSMDQVDQHNVHSQVNVLKEQRKITARQPINANAPNGHERFFMYESYFDGWEFFAIAVDELILSTVIGISVMSGIALFFVAHWTAVLFVCPLISILYVDLLGFMQFGGVSINAISYISLVIGLGLLVDYVLHVIICFYQCKGDRRQKTIEMLETMGVSVLCGGTTTCLGVLPLTLSSSTIFHTIFIAFVGLALLGMAHSLILLPVLLSTIGPDDEHEDSGSTCSKDAAHNNNDIHPDTNKARDEEDCSGFCSSETATVQGSSSSSCSSSLACSVGKENEEREACV